jgi:hypothetical protein
MEAQIPVSSDWLKYKIFMGGHEVFVKDGTPWSVYAYGGKRERLLRV